MASGSAALTGGPSSPSPSSWSSKLQEAQQLAAQGARLEFAKEYSKAFALYIRAGEMYLWLARSHDVQAASSSQRAKGVDNLPGEGADLKGRIRKAADKVLSRAQLIKSLRTDLRPVQRRILSQQEQTRALDHASRIGSIELPAWQGEPSDSAFAGSIFTSSRLSTPRLAPLQIERKAKYKRRTDRLYWSDDQLYNPQQQLRGRDILQDVINDCSFVAALEVAVEHDRRWGTTLAHAPLYPKDAAGNPKWSDNGRYLVKLFLNGCFRSVEIDESIPCDETGKPLSAMALGGEDGSKMQLWPALLEKAYLSLYGGYDFGGSNSSIDLHALTGWIPEHIGFRHSSFQREKSWARIYSAFSRGDLMITAGTGRRTSSSNSIENVHLTDSHNYAVLDLIESDGERELVLMNPWRRQTTEDAPWTDALRSTLPRVPGDAGAAAKSPGIFRMTWDEACSRLDSLHLSWNPTLSKHSVTFHSIWPRNSGKGPGNEASTGQNVQVLLHVNNDDIGGDEQPEADVWLHLTKHLVKKGRAISPAQTEWIAVHAFQNQMENMDVQCKGTYVDSSNILTRLKAKRKGEYLVVASRQIQLEQAASVGPTDDDKGTSFTVSAYSNARLSLSEPDDSLTYSSQIDGQWTARTAGGSAFHSTFMHNPQYSITVPNATTGSSATSRIRIVAETSREIALQVMLVWAPKSETSTSGVRRVDHVVPGDIVCSSGSYTYGVAIAESSSIKPGTPYALIISTYSPNTEGHFTLRIQSEAAQAIVQPLAAEGAGMHQQRLRASWSVSEGTACGAPRYGRYRENPSFTFDVVRPTRFTVRLVANPSHDSASEQPQRPHINVAIFSLPSNREWASSGPYADQVCGVAIHHALLDPGRYAIISSTFQPNVEMPFSLFVYSDRSIPIEKPVH